MHRYDEAPASPPPSEPGAGNAYPQLLKTKNLPSAGVRELPEMPASTWKIIGPGIVGAGVGLASGEFILWPYIASQVGLIFLWGAVIGLITQWFLNMEIERYTLATGETALAGFNRYWRHWGLFFALLSCFANLWPGWATSSATMISYLFGGTPKYIAVGILLAVGLILTLAPVVYTVLERTIFLKVAAITVFLVVAAIVAIKGSSWEAVAEGATHVGEFPSEQLGFAVLMGAIAYAGAGGGQNLCQANWIRDKGFGMGRYVPRLVSPVTGQEEAAPESQANVFPQDQANLERWRRWWRFANWEQALTFGVVTLVTIVFMSMLAHSTLFGQEGLENSIDFLRAEGEGLKEAVGPWFGVLFWVIGAFSLFAAAVGIVDYTGRLAADVLKTTYLQRSRLSESRLYFGIVWALVSIGIIILLSGLEQPLVMLVISACTSGVMMFFYSIMLLVMNRRALPKAIRVRSYRVVALIWSIGFFGYLSALTIKEQWNVLFD